ncbi:DUF5994 family protein [Streptomyces sp. CB01373]|uniref:DUF5994 family protein n=1 Tax=Streptomyces sp. CB01373 TaxID=2020325 RepID=UPI002277C591|nr:DUF5994 family protein [Streptomyces sp. CB01373]
MSRFRASLPSLITVLAEHLGFVTRFGLDAGVWEGLPTRLLVDDRVVHIDSLPVGDDTVLSTRGDRDHFSLAGGPTGHAARRGTRRMARALRADSVAGPEQILIDTASDTPHPPT